MKCHLRQTYILVHIGIQAKREYILGILYNLGLELSQCKPSFQRYSKKDLVEEESFRLSLGIHKLNIS